MKNGERAVHVLVDLGHALLTAVNVLSRDANVMPRLRELLIRLSCYHHPRHI